MLGKMPAPQSGWREDCETFRVRLPRPYNEDVGTSEQALRLGTDDHIRIALGLTTAE